MTVGAQRDHAHVPTEQPLPHFDGSLVTASCECGRTLTLDTTVALSRAGLCRCGLSVGDGLARGPHHRDIIRHTMDRNNARRRAQIEEHNVVYFVRVAGVVKIGTTGNLPQRLRNLGRPTLLGVVDGGYDVETAMHRRFRHLRIHGEKFEAAPELLEFVAQHCYIPTLKRAVAAHVDNLSLP